MHPDDHYRITLAVLQRMVQEGITFNEEFVNGIEDGLLSPSNVSVNPCLRIFFSHHDYSREEIRELIVTAREHLKRKEMYKAGFSVGLALHYLQDRCLGGIFINEFTLQHYKTETRFSLEPLAEEQIVDGLVDASSKWGDVDWVIDNTEMSYRAKNAMKKACYVTAFVLYSVIQKDPPEEVAMREKRWARLRLALSVALGVAATALVALYYPVHGYKVLGLLFAWLPLKGAYSRFSKIKRWYS